MSRPTISTGGIPIMDKSSEQPAHQAPGNLPCHVLILADFSGRTHRGQDDASDLFDRRIIAVTRDNLDEVFQRLQVTLDIAVAEKPITFNEPDDLHPDFLYERVSLFDQFRALKRQLQNPDSFAAAAARIQSWAPPAAPKKTAADYTSISVPATDEGMQTVLDELLHSTAAEQEQRQSVQGLIQQIVAPYVIPAADPRLPELLQTVDDASSHLMRKILHSSAFQGIESTWRGLQWLMKQLDTDDDLRIFIADISLNEIAADNAAHEDEPTQLHKLLIDNRLTKGTVPFSLILADYELRDELEHCDALANLGSVAADLNAVLLCGGSPRIAGCASLIRQPEPTEWTLHGPDDDFTLLWNAIREQDYSPHVAVVTPRFLQRLPYGQRTRPCQSFRFEELPRHTEHAYYLWGNGAWLLAAVLGQAFNDNGWQPPSSALQTVRDLPLHLHERDGEKTVTPCAEIQMTDATAGALEQAGLLVIRSIRDQDAVIISSLQSLHPDADLAGRWFYS